MDKRVIIFLLLFLFESFLAIAQKPFSEGTIIYKVKLESDDHKVITGYYTFTIKGNQVKKEVKLNNGFQEVLLLNCGTNKVYSLENNNGKKYAIELSMADMLQSQQKFNGYIIKNEETNQKEIAGYAVYKGNINYKDGTRNDIYYTKEWRPTQPVTFERFPEARFFPLFFSYKDENNMAMEFEAEKITPGPIENAVFRIPPDYQMISNAEYKELTR